MHNKQTFASGKSPGLIRGLGLWSATSIVVGSMIGQSVFLVASDMAQQVNSPMALLAVWLVGGVVVLFGAFCYAELGAAMPEAGGDYIYLSRGIGPIWGFLFGWTSSIIMRPGSAATIVTGLSRFVAFLLPAVTAPIVAWDLQIPFHLSPYRFSLTGAQVLAAAVIVVVTGLNYLGVRTAGRFQVLLTTLKIATVIAIVILGLMAGSHGEVETATIATPDRSAVGGFLLALVPVMLAYNGFQYLGCVGSEVMNPRKNLPMAAILGTSLVVALYLLVNWIYLRLLGFSQVARSHHVASDAVALVVGDVGAKWFTIALIISAFGTVHAVFLTGPRVPYAMAQEGNFFRFARRIQPTFHSPSGAVIFQGFVAILLVLTGTYQELYSYTMFATWIFLALTAVALIRLRFIQPDLVRPFRVWGYPWTVLVFGVAAFAFALNLWLVRPVRSSIGLAIILLGVPFFLRWRNRGIIPFPARPVIR